jgi:hypothetical protein
MPRAKATQRPARTDWNDESLKCMVTLDWLSATARKRAFKAAIDKHVTEDDCDPSEGLVQFLREFPLGETELATITAVTSPSAEVLHSIIPQFDGEEDPFPVQSWSDISRLPNLERIVPGSSDSALPTAANLTKHDRLREVMVSLSNDRGKSQAVAIQKLADASGFAITTLQGDWITLERKTPSPAQALLLKLRQFLPLSSFRAGKIRFQLDLLGATLSPRGLTASFRLHIYPSGDAASETVTGTVPLLSAKDSTAHTADAKLEANIATLIAHIKANQALPTASGNRLEHG